MKCKCGKEFKEKPYGKGALMCNSCTSNRRRFAKKLLAIKYAGGCCVICGYNKCPAALEFDHLDPTQKDFQISGKHCMSWERLMLEIDKCQLVCANCHREKHYRDSDHRRFVEEQVEREVLKTTLCKTCGKSFESYIKRNQKFCSYVCARVAKICWPPPPKLVNEIKRSSFIAVSNKLGVSDNAIRKHLKKHGIDPKKVRSIKNNGAPHSSSG